MKAVWILAVSLILAGGSAAPAQTAALFARSGSIGGDHERLTPGDCRNRAFQCGVTAFNRRGGEASLRWFRLAASQGSVRAMRALGLIHLGGEGGVPRDAETALGWFYEAALRGDAQSMFMLARAFEEGAGVEADPAIATWWLERSAATGYRPAQRALEP